MANSPATFSPSGHTYSLEERARLKAAFTSISATYRTYIECMLWCFLLAALALCITCAPASIHWVGLLFVPSFFGGVFLGFRAAALLKCPGCSQSLGKIKTYCLNCGSPDLTNQNTRGERWSMWHCNTCDSNLSDGKRMFCEIRICSTCGLCLDEQGLETWSKFLATPRARI
jgi:hypothetical protein